MYPTIIYELHIFKDVENTSWTNPKVHTFPLTEAAASPLIRSNESKGGVGNLRRCSPEQLTFLQSHLAAKNAILKSAREVEMEAQKAREAREEKEAQIQEEKRAKEVEKWQQSMKEMTSKLKENDVKEGGNVDNGDEHEEGTGPQPSRGSNPMPFPPPPRPFPYPGGPIGVTDNFRRDESTPVYPYPSNHLDFSTYPSPLPPMFRSHSSRLPPPPPPPPPVIRYRKTSPLQRESDWKLESVDLDLIPVVARLKLKKLKASSLGSKDRHVCYNDYEYRRVGTRMPRIGYQLADSAKVEVAVLYSRIVMTKIPHAMGGRVREQVGFYAHGSEVGGSVYEYESDVDMNEVLAKKEEGDEEDEDEEEEGQGGNNEEEDLEIVEGFNHCHPLTESMSKCCLEKEC